MTGTPVPSLESQPRHITGHITATRIMHIQSATENVQHILFTATGVCLTPNSGSSSTVGGMWWYDFSTKEFTRITTRGRYYYWYESDDVAIGTYSSYGCSVYDKATRQWHVPATSGTYYCAAVSEDGIILGGDSSTTGLKYFDFETGQLTTIDASGPWYYACKVPEGFLVSSGTSSKLGYGF